MMGSRGEDEEAEETGGFGFFLLAPSMEMPWKEGPLMLEDAGGSGCVVRGTCGFLGFWAD
jgi:hypothetical protein